MMKYVLLFALIAVAVAADDESHAEIVSLKSDVSADGFDYALETSNHISSHASGDEHGNIHGEYSYISPQGEPVKVTYVANENGYQPSGEWIPTPPPVPPQIIKALEYIRTHPPHDEHHH